MGAIALDAVHAVLTSVHELKETHSAEKLSAANALLHAYSNLRENHQTRSRNLAPDHNLIRLLGIERSEIGLHSPFLADLLDPYGSHGQGGVFLRKFLITLAKHNPKFPELSNAVAEPTPFGQWIIGRERERIDVSIRNRRLGLLIFIENKIDAHEQPDQLARYRLRLDNHIAYQYRFLVYLRPKAKGPPLTGTPDICLTYEEDIVFWLRSCKQDVHPEHVRSNLRQYIDVISNW